MATKPELAMPRSWAEAPSDNRFLAMTSACLLISDLAALSLLATLTVLGGHAATPAYLASDGYVELIPFLAMFFPAFLVGGLYPGILLHPAEETRRTFYATCLVIFAWISLAFLRQPTLHARSILLTVWVLGAPAVLTFRHLTREWFGGKPWWGARAVIIGSGPIAQMAARKLRNGKLGVRVVGIMREENVAATPIAQYAIVAMDRQVIDGWRGFSKVLIAPDVRSVCSLGIRKREGGLSTRRFPRIEVLLKRALDLATSGVLLVILSPLFAAIAIAIKLTSRGPVFFGHRRLGRTNQAFPALKFRTMMVNADEVLAGYLESHPEERLEWQRHCKLRGDPRITKVGKWLRRYSLDELPQLFNVCMGQMSLIGPRPITEDEILKYGESYVLYSRVLPGITGLWQVSGRSNTSYEERVGLDESYVCNWSIWLDLYILVRTVGVVLSGEGAY